MSNRVRLVDVARETGLATSTVSGVLNGRGLARIPEATAARVRAAAARLGYAADPTARGLRTGRSGAIGFISDEVTVTRYASAMIRGMLDVADARDHVVLMTECDHQWNRVERALDVLRARRSDGLLFGLMRARQIDLLEQAADRPARVVNGVAPGLGAVLPDETSAGQDAVAHLVRHGHRRIAFIGRAAEHLDPRVSVTIGSRLAGIDAAMAAAGLTFSCEATGSEWEPDLGYAGALSVLDRAPDITAIIASNDRVAFGIYQAAQIRGLQIPRDLSVISFDDEQLATYLRPQLTTMRLPYREMGALAMSSLLDGLQAGEDAGTEPTSLLVPMPLADRESVRAI